MNQNAKLSSIVCSISCVFDTIHNEIFQFFITKHNYNHHGNIHQHFLIQQTILCKILFEPPTNQNSKSKKKEKKRFFKQKTFFESKRRCKLRIERARSVNKRLRAQTKMSALPACARSLPPCVQLSKLKLIKKKKEKKKRSHTIASLLSISRFLFSQSSSRQMSKN